MRILIVLVLILSSMSVMADSGDDRLAKLTGIIGELMSEQPRHKLSRVHDEREALAREILEASEKYPVAFPELVLWVAYKESTFSPRRTGDGGRSKGIMQFGLVVRRGCKKELGLNLKERADQLVCGAYWIQRLEKRCGSLHRGLAAYSSKGGLCGGTPRGSRIARNRIAKAKRLRDGQ